MNEELLIFMANCMMRNLYWWQKIFGKFNQRIISKYCKFIEKENKLYFVVNEVENEVNEQYLNHLITEFCEKQKNNIDNIIDKN